jgi:hypothetical protein
MDIKIEDLTRETNTGLVVKVSFSFSKASSNHTTYYHAPDLHFEGNASASDFIQYDSLTQEIVEQWIENSYSQERLDEIESILDQKLVEVITPTTTTGIPWVQ